MDTSVRILTVLGEPCAGPQGWSSAGRSRCSRQGRLVWKSLYLSAMQQCTSTFSKSRARLIQPFYLSSYCLC